jgi:hypothetical protein
MTLQFVNTVSLMSGPEHPSHQREYKSHSGAYNAGCTNENSTILFSFLERWSQISFSAGKIWQNNITNSVLFKYIFLMSHTTINFISLVPEVNTSCDVQWTGI